MRDRVARRVVMMTRSELAAAIATNLFDMLVLAGFSVMKLRRVPAVDQTLEAAEDLLAEIRPRVGVRSDENLYRPSEDIDLSVVVPAYNAEAHLAECLDSAIGQCTMYRHEIVVVDDGSTDGTARILDSYRGHDNLSVIRTANAGVATARNRGIARARGEYLLFLDSDDRLERHCVERLLKVANDSRADIVQGGYHVIDESGTVIGEVGFEVDSRCIPQARRRTSGYPWGKAIRRKMFEKARFPDGMDFEDTIVMLVLSPLCGRYVAFADPVYAYRDNSTGITRTVVHSASALDAYWIVPVLLEQRERLGIPVDGQLFNEVQIQFGELLWLRLAGQSSRVVQTTFAAACAVVNALRDQVGAASCEPEGPYLDYAFRECRYDLWAYACRFGLQ